VLYGAVSLVVEANVFNIGADLGSMAAAMRLLLPALEVFVSYQRYAKILRCSSGRSRDPRRTVRRRSSQPTRLPERLSHSQDVSRCSCSPRGSSAPAPFGALGAGVAGFLAHGADQHAVSLGAIAGVLVGLLVDLAFHIVERQPVGSARAG
jgi:hypothetical protein